MVQQSQERQYDDVKINQYFLRSLELSEIPKEVWKGFAIFEGKNWYGLTKDQLYSEARTFYNTHIVPYLSKTTIPATSQTQSGEYKALAINRSIEQQE